MWLRGQSKQASRRVLLRGPETKLWEYAYLRGELTPDEAEEFYGEKTDRAAVWVVAQTQFGERVLWERGSKGGGVLGERGLPDWQGPGGGGETGDAGGGSRGWRAQSALCTMGSNAHGRRVQRCSGLGGLAEAAERTYRGLLAGEQSKKRATDSQVRVAAVEDIVRAASATQPSWYFLRKPVTLLEHEAAPVQMVAAEGELGDGEEPEDSWAQCGRCKAYRSVAESVRRLYEPRDARFECKYVLPNGCRTPWRDGPEKQWYGDEAHRDLAPPGAASKDDGPSAPRAQVGSALRLELVKDRVSKPKPAKATKPAGAGKARKVSKTVAKVPPSRTSRSGRVLKLPDHVQPFLDFEFEEEK